MYLHLTGQALGPGEHRGPEVPTHRSCLYPCWPPLTRRLPRPCRLEAAPLKDVSEWVERYRRFWEESFDRLDAYLQELQAKEKKDGRKNARDRKRTRP